MTSNPPSTLPKHPKRDETPTPNQPPSAASSPKPTAKKNSATSFADFPTTRFFKSSGAGCEEDSSKKAPYNKPTTSTSPNSSTRRSNGKTSIDNRSIDIIFEAQP